jgi:hypothetical protein
MVKHIVMWALKPEANGKTAADNAAQIKTRLEGLRGKIPGLKYLEVGVNVFASTPGCNAVLYSEFPSRADLDAYAAHPLHQECVAFIKQVVSERRVVDYEI